MRSLLVLPLVVAELMRSTYNYLLCLTKRSTRSRFGYVLKQTTTPAQLVN